MACIGLSDAIVAVAASVWLRAKSYVRTYATIEYTGNSCYVIVMLLLLLYGCALILKPVLFPKQRRCLLNASITELKELNRLDALYYCATGDIIRCKRVAEIRDSEYQLWLATLFTIIS